MGRIDMSLSKAMGSMAVLALVASVPCPVHGERSRASSRWIRPPAATRPSKEERAERYRRAYAEAKRKQARQRAEWEKKARKLTPGAIRFLRRDLIKRGKAAFGDPHATERAKRFCLAMAGDCNLQELRADVQRLAKDDPSLEVRQGALKALHKWTRRQPADVQASAEMTALSDDVLQDRAKRKRALNAQLCKIVQAERDEIIAAIRTRLEDPSSLEGTEAEKKQKQIEASNEIYKASQYDLHEVKDEFKRLAREGSSSDWHAALWLTLRHWDRPGANAERADKGLKLRANWTPSVLGKVVGMVAAVRGDLWEHTGDVRRLSQEDPSPKVRQAAALVLKEWKRQDAEYRQAGLGAAPGEDKAITIPKDDRARKNRDKVLACVRRALENPEQNLRDRLMAIGAARRVDPRELRPELEHAAEANPEPKIRRAAAGVLNGWLRRDKELARNRIRELESRRRAAMTPEQLRQEKADERRARYLRRREQLLNQLQHGTLETRRTFAMYAKEWADVIPEALPILHKIVRTEKDPELRMRALSTITRVQRNSPEAIALLRSCLSPDHPCRQFAATRLCLYGHKEGLPVLIGLLDHAKDPRAQVHLLHSLNLVTRLSFTDLKLGLMLGPKEVSEEDQAKLKKAVLAWQKWWEQEGKTFVLPRARAKQARSQPAGARANP